jgi:hypothetical protein
MWNNHISCSIIILQLVALPLIIAYKLICFKIILASARSHNRLFLHVYIKYQRQDLTTFFYVLACPYFHIQIPCQYFVFRTNKDAAVIFKCVQIDIGITSIKNFCTFHFFFVVPSELSYTQNSVFILCNWRFFFMGKL